MNLMEMWNEKVVGPILESWGRGIEYEEEYWFCYELDRMLQVTALSIPERQFEYSGPPQHNGVQIMCLESDMGPKKTPEGGVSPGDRVAA